MISESTGLRGRERRSVARVSKLMSGFRKQNHQKMGKGLIQGHGGRRVGKSNGVISQGTTVLISHQKEGRRDYNDLGKGDRSTLY